jgi:hypothetical protein
MVVLVRLDENEFMDLKNNDRKEQKMKEQMKRYPRRRGKRVSGVREFADSNFNPFWNLVVLRTIRMVCVRII